MSNRIPTASLISPKTPRLRVGFVPLNDCAPLAMAQELGFFARQGVAVELKRELGWATIRDKIIYGELDAAHAVAGLPFAASLGLGSIQCDCVSGMVLSLQGNAITLSQDLWLRGVRDAAGLHSEILRSRGRRTFTFGVVFPFSTHHFLLRQWLLSSGIQPDRDVRIVVVPPPQMFPNLEAGNLDGYCVGEPWNSIAVRNKVGWCAAISSELAPLHPEKVLMVRRRFAEERPAEHLALIAALIAACEYCDRPENAGHVIDTLARPAYLNTPQNVLGRSLQGSFDFGNGRVEAQPDFHVFHRYAANVPSPDRANWILSQMVQSGAISDRSALKSEAVQGAFRPDLFHEAEKQLGHSIPHDPESKARPSIVPV